MHTAVSMGNNEHCIHDRFTYTEFMQMLTTIYSKQTHVMFKTYPEVDFIKRVFELFITIQIEAHGFM